MNSIEKQLREHYTQAANPPVVRDIAAEVIAGGRRLRARRRMRRGAIAVAMALALAWGVSLVPSLRFPTQNNSESFVAAADLPVAEREQQEAAIATFLEGHDFFSWIDDSGGRVVCATQELGESKVKGRFRVYVWAYCANRGGEAYSGVNLPLAVELDASGTPARMPLPPDIKDDGTYLRTNFPRVLWDDVHERKVDFDRLNRQFERRAADADFARD